MIDEALRLTATNFDRFWEAELHRLRGELLLLQAGNNPLGKDQGTAAEGDYMLHASEVEAALQQHRIGLQYFFEWPCGAEEGEYTTEHAIDDGIWT